MDHSEQINELAVALAKAQPDIKAALKSSDNPFFKSKYADLTSVSEACLPALNKNGLSVIQGCEQGDGERVSVSTMLLHTSGQWISSTLTMKPVKADPQGLGSCITYARRYSLAAIAGVCTEDDDGNAASANVSAKPQTKPKDHGDEVPGTEPVYPKHEPGTPSQSQRKAELQMEIRELLKDERLIKPQKDMWSQKSTLPGITVKELEGILSKINGVLS